MAERNDEEEQSVNQKSGIAYAAAFTLFLTVATMVGLGLLLDRWLGTTPWLLVTCIVLGSVVGLYQFIRISSRMN